MDYNKINYQVIEEAFMNSESKEYIQQIFEAVATNILDSEIYTMKSENLPLSLKNIPKVLNITNDKALIVNSLPLIFVAYHFSAQSNERIHWHFDA